MQEENANPNQKEKQRKQNKNEQFSLRSMSNRMQFFCLLHFFSNLSCRNEKLSINYYRQLQFAELITLL